MSNFARQSPLFSSSICLLFLFDFNQIYFRRRISNQQSLTQITDELAEQIESEEKIHLENVTDAFVGAESLKIKRSSATIDLKGHRRQSNGDKTR